MKFSHRNLIILSGSIWLLMGIYLLQLGLTFLVGGLKDKAAHLPLVELLTKFLINPETAVICLVFLATYIGYFKGRYVLGKSARKGILRICSFDNPAPIHRIYDVRYYILIGIMIALGISIKYMGFSNDVRGFIDVLIGSALVNGAVVYFRHAVPKKSAE